ncbi:DNA-methyltransferase [Acidobacteriota bacterium]
MVTGRRKRASKPPEPFHSSFDGRVGLYLGDCLDILPVLCTEDRPRVIFADPPYFLSDGGITCKAGRMVSVNKGKWDVPKGIRKTHEFNRAWLQACQQALHPDGTIWVSGTAHIIHSVGFAMQELGFKLLNDITWVKPNPPPNLSCRYFTHATETVIWAARNEKSKHTFNYDTMKRLNQGKQMKSVWTITAPGREEKRFGKHPTQKPLALLVRILQASANEGDLVADPFNGTGTTGLAAARLGMRYIGIELEKEFLEVSRKRLKDLEQNPSL